MIQRDGYSNFKFFQAIPPQDGDGNTAVTGASVDLLGYQTCTFVVNIGAFTGAGSISDGQMHQFRVAFGVSDTAGSVGWTCADASMILHSEYGEAGAYSVLTSGIVISIDSCTFSGTAVALGIKNMGNYRWARLVWSGSGTPSVVSAGAIAILGNAGDWPVNTPVAVTGE